MSEDRSTYLLMLAAAILLALVLGAYALVRRSASSSGLAEPPLTGEEQAYLSQIEVTGARMSAAKNYIGDTLIYLDARVTNKGPRAIRRLTLELEFFNPSHQVVFRDKTQPVRLGMAPLQPGSSRSFQASFEKLPEDWDRAPPTIKAAAVHF